MKFEVIKQPGRKPRWRLRDSSTGAIVPLAPARVPLPPTIEENRRVRDAVDSVLTKLAREHAADAGGR